VLSHALAAALSAIRWPEVTQGKLNLVCLPLLLSVASREVEDADAGLLISALALCGLLGYLANNAADRDDDAAAGKANLFIGRPAWVPAAALSSLLVALALSLVGLGSVRVAMLVAAQVALAAAYSLPPARLKGRGLIGLLAALLAQYIAPMAIVLLATGQTSPLAWSAWVGLVGLHGLALEVGHQLQDVSADRRVGTSTFAARGDTVALTRAYQRLLRALGVALLLLPVGLAAALTATLEDWKAVAAALPLIWVACSLTWAVRVHLRGREHLPVDPFYASRGDVLDRLFSTLPSLFAPLWLGTVAASIGDGAWIWGPVTLLWVWSSAPGRPWRWYLDELRWLAWPPEL